jgi:chorismate mutase/prephenate dehydratase
MAESRNSSRAAAAPEGDTELEALRRRIDAIDREILERLNARAEVVREVGGLKATTGAPVYASTREQAIVGALTAENPGPFPNAGIAPVFREIISASRSLEAPLRVAYLGPHGTFCHAAARQRFGEGTELADAATISDVFALVERGVASLGVVPIENTTEGAVTQTLDALAEFDGVICGELQLRVSHQLLSRSGRIEDVRRVASHPQVLAQCRRWLDRNLPGPDRIETASSAAAAELSRDDPEVAAIGSAIAGEVYGLETIEPAIEDRRDNTTRFLVIGRQPVEPSGDDLTSVLFTIHRDQAGALFRLLEPLAAGAVNLTAIHSRPIAGKPWEYFFFIDLEGHADDERVAAALESASQVAHSHRVLGSFPRAEALRRSGRAAGES